MSEGGQVALLNETKINIGDFDMNIPRHILSPDETAIIVDYPFRPYHAFVKNMTFLRLFDWERDGLVL